MNILFVHAGLGQFGPVHRYINEMTNSKSWLLCSEAVYKANREKFPNLVAFKDASEINETFFYIRRLEQRVRRSFVIRAACMKLIKERSIDVIIAHGSGGFPLELFDEAGVPIISYIEFPSFKAHGHDPKYPPSEALTFRDRLFEMYSFHQAVRSDLVITPSLHAKKMFPDFLHHKIIVQMDGLEIRLPVQSSLVKDGIFRIGFVARDLSSAKGVEHFILTAKEIRRQRSQVRFVLLGSKDMRYSYEDNFVREQPEFSSGMKFLDYLFQREGIDLKDGVFEHIDYLPYDKYSQLFDRLDLLHYPLQFGSANWGLFEALFRGKTVVGSDQCFVPEVIRDGHNGLICRYSDIGDWVRRTLEIVDAPSSFKHLGENARVDAMHRFHVSAVASRYFEICSLAISQRKLQ